MTWSDPATGSAFFDTNDVPTEGNFDTYIFDNLLSLMHPLEAPTTADLDVVSSAAETTLYSVTVPANALGANGSVRVEVWGDYLKNANIDMTFRGKFGGSTLLADTVAWGAVTGANRQPWKMEFELLNKGATNSQLLWLRLATVNANSPAPTTGIGELEILQHPLGLMNTAAIDTTVDQTLLISVQWASASASASWRRRWARSLIGRN